MQNKNPRTLFTIAVSTIVLLILAGVLSPASSTEPLPQSTITATVFFYMPAVMHEWSAPSPTPTATTPTVYCTPPPCDFAAGEVYHCPDVCPGGCGTECATATPEPGS